MERNKNFDAGKDFLSGDNWRRGIFIIVGPACGGGAVF